MALKRADYRSVVRLDRWCFGASSSVIEIFLQKINRSDLAILVLTGHDAVISKDVEDIHLAEEVTEREKAKAATPKKR